MKTTNAQRVIDGATIDNIHAEYIAAPNQAWFIFWGAHLLRVIPDKTDAVEFIAFLIG